MDDSMVHNSLLKPMVLISSASFPWALNFAVLQVACRMVEIALGIRYVFRCPPDRDLSDPEQEDCPDVPVRGNYDGKFAEALPTQGLPAALIAGAAEDEVEAEADNSHLLLSEPQAWEEIFHLF